LANVETFIRELWNIAFIKRGEIMIQIQIKQNDYFLEMKFVDQMNKLKNITIASKIKVNEVILKQIEPKLYWLKYWTVKTSELTNGLVVGIER
jgi:hypothetical protein